MKTIARSAALAGLLATLALSAPALPSREATLRAIYSQALDAGYSRHTTIEADGTTFVSSGLP